MENSHPKKCDLQRFGCSKIEKTFMQWPVADVCYEPEPSQEFIRDVYQTFVEIDTKETGFMNFEVDHAGMEGVGIGWMEWVGWRFVHNEYTVMGNDPWPRGIRPSARSSARRVSFDVGVFSFIISRI